MSRILITGGAGLVGTGLTPALLHAGHEVTHLDLGVTGVAQGDVRDAVRVRQALEEVDGIVHLAAVSRVIWGEQDPDLCKSTNVDGTRTVLAAAVESPRRPWVLMASSREVYGEPAELPVAEDAPLVPVNVYGRTKIAGESLVFEARSHGLDTAIARLSNVYGSIHDHADRVIPAFARASARGTQLRVDGRDHTFDFTHLDDTVRGLARMVELLDAGESRLPPIHLLTGAPTTLGELADLAVALGDRGASIREAPPRSYDVARFVGDPTRARELLGWSARIPLREGLSRLIADFAADAELEAPCAS